MVLRCTLLLGEVVLRKGVLVFDADLVERRLRDEGSPLIDPGPPGRVTATFVFRVPAGSGIRHVYLEANGITDRHDPEAHALKPLGEGDLWSVSVVLPETWRGGYGFLPRTEPVTRPSDDETEWEWWRGVLGDLVTDPWNRLPSYSSMGQRPRSEAVMPGAPAQLWWRHAAEEARGVLTEEMRELAGVRRRIWIYEPPGLAEAGRPVLVVFDGKVTAVEIPLAPALDRLAERGVRVPLVVMIDSIDPATRSRELPCSADFLDALTGDLLPWLRAEWRTTASAASVVAAGSSYGGLAATYAALHAPRHFGGAVSLSGSFWWPRPGMPGQPDEEAQSVQQQLDGLDVHGSRFWMTAGELEPRLIAENREVRDLLRAKRFDVEYREFCSGHDYVHWRDALVAGAAALLGPAAAREPRRRG